MSEIGSIADGLVHVGLPFAAGLAASSATHHALEKGITSPAVREASRFIQWKRSMFVSGSYFAADYLVRRFAFKESVPWQDLVVSMGEVALIAGLGGFFPKQTVVRMAASAIVAGAAAVARDRVLHDGRADSSLGLSVLLSAGLAALGASPTLGKTVGNWEIKHINDYLDRHMFPKNSKVPAGFTRHMTDDGIIVSEFNPSPRQSPATPADLIDLALPPRRERLYFIPGFGCNERSAGILPQAFARNHVFTTVLYPWSLLALPRTGLLGVAFLTDRLVNDVPLLLYKTMHHYRKPGDAVQQIGYSLGAAFADRVDEMFAIATPEITRKTLQVCPPPTFKLARIPGFVPLVDLAIFFRFIYPKAKIKKLTPGMHDPELSALTGPRERQWYALAQDRAVQMAMDLIYGLPPISLRDRMLVMIGRFDKVVHIPSALKIIRDRFNGECTTVQVATDHYPLFVPESVAIMFRFFSKS